MGIFALLRKRPEPSIYDRVGGLKALEVIVEDFYARVLADEELANFFAGTNLTRLKDEQAGFFAAAFGGPESYTGRSLRHVHRGRGITTHHFNLVAGHLTNSLSAAGVPAETISEILDVVAPLAGDIASDATADAQPGPSQLNDDRERV
jgi:hemoglobin